MHIPIIQDVRWITNFFKQPFCSSSPKAVFEHIAYHRITHYTDVLLHFSFFLKPPMLLLLLLLCKTPLDGVLLFCDDRRVPVLFVTKWDSRISRERFNIELTNFEITFTLVPSIKTLEMTSLSTSSRKLSTFEERPTMTPSMSST